MKPYLRQQLGPIVDINLGLPIVREYLQARVLECLQEAGAFLCLAFHGGTSLRFLYDIARYSEDLDFSLEGSPAFFDFDKYLSHIVRRFAAEAYAVDVRTQKQQAVVHKASIRFKGLLHEMGLSPFPEQVVAIKIEVDTRPPQYAGLATTLVQRHVDLHLRHHDKATLLAGKVLAILNRAYAKGRDWYDLWWYLQQEDWPLPNFPYLNDGQRQVNDAVAAINAQNWRALLAARLQRLDWTAVYDDVAPFIIDLDRQPGFNQGNLLALLRAD